MYNKYTDGDKVAVIIHGSWGQGWYSFHGQEDMLFHPQLAKAIEAQAWMEAAEIIREELRVPYWYTPNPSLETIALTAKELVVEWIPRGEKFIVHEYDGMETIWLKRNMKWIQS